MKDSDNFKPVITLCSCARLLQQSIYEFSISIKFSCVGLIYQYSTYYIIKLIINCNSYIYDGDLDKGALLCMLITNGSLSGLHELPMYGILILLA